MKKLFAILMIIGLMFVGGARMSVYADVDPDDFLSFQEYLPRP